MLFFFFPYFHALPSLLSKNIIMLRFTSLSIVAFMLASAAMVSALPVNSCAQDGCVDTTASSIHGSKVQKQTASGTGSMMSIVKRKAHDEPDEEERDENEKDENEKDENEKDENGKDEDEKNEH